MTKWLIVTMIATFLGGFMPIFSNRSVKIHGPIPNMAILTIFFALVISGYLIMHPEEFSLITKKSLVFTLFASLFSFSSTWLIFYAYMLAPAEKLPVIILTAGFSVIITAIISHFLGQKMEMHRWIGAVITLVGLVLVNLEKTTIKNFFSR